MKNAMLAFCSYGICIVIYLSGCGQKLPPPIEQENPFCSNTQDCKNQYMGSVSECLNHICTITYCNDDKSCSAGQKCSPENKCVFIEKCSNDKQCNDRKTPGQLVGTCVKKNDEQTGLCYEKLCELDTAKEECRGQDANSKEKYVLCFSFCKENQECVTIKTKRVCKYNDSEEPKSNETLQDGGEHIFETDTEKTVMPENQECRQVALSGRLATSPGQRGIDRQTLSVFPVGSVKIVSNSCQNVVWKVLKSCLKVAQT